MEHQSTMAANRTEALVRSLRDEAGAACTGLVDADGSTPAVRAGDPVLALAVAHGAAVAAARRRAPECLFFEGGDHGCPPGLGMVATVAVPVAGGAPILFAGFTGARPASAVTLLLPAYAAAVARHLDEIAITDPASGTGEEPAAVISDARQGDGPIVHAGRGWCALTGYHPDEVLGRNPRLLQRDDRDQPGRWRIRGALERGEPARTSLNNFRRDGTRFRADLELVPVRAGGGARTSHWIGLLWHGGGAAAAGGGVERVTAERLHALELSAVGKLVIDRATGCVQFANPVAGRMLGRHPGALIGRDAALGQPLEGRVQLRTTPAAAPVEAEMICRAVQWGQRPAWLVTLFDVTAAPGGQGEPLPGAAPLDHPAAPLVRSRPDGSIAGANQGAADLFGYSRDAMTRLETGRLDAGGLVDGEAWARNWAFVRMQGSVTLATRLRRCDGWTLPAMLDVQHVEHDGEERHLVMIRALGAA